MEGRDEMGCMKCLGMFSCCQKKEKKEEEEEKPFGVGIRNTYAGKGRVLGRDVVSGVWMWPMYIHKLIQYV